MKARLEDKKLAIELRKNGLSYKEIQQKVLVSKSLLSGWFKYLELSPKEENVLRSRMKERMDKGRISSTLSNRERRMEREKIACSEAEKMFNKFKDQSEFLVGISLYWAEGSKRTGEFQFINSDPEMIIFMYKWIQKYIGIKKNMIKCRLFLHRIPGYENSHVFWSRKLELEPYLFEKTIYKPTQHVIKKNPNYNGCLRLSIGGIYHLRIVKAWQKLLIQYYGNV